MCIYTYMYICKYICIGIAICINIYVFRGTYIYVCIDLCACTCLMYIHVYVSADNTLWYKTLFRSLESRQDAQRMRCPTMSQDSPYIDPMQWAADS